MAFADIAGHDRVIEVLRRSLRSGKTSHSYIFEGPPGCGRRMTALALVQAMFCTESIDDACGRCIPCRKVAGSNHGDIHFLEPLPEKRDIAVDQLRELQRELAMRPYEADRKICIMEPAERMNVNSANSLLKTLEEPPGNSLIILIAENAGMLLPTIRSRCQLLRFSPLSPENVQLLLERGGMPTENAQLLAPMADGNMHRALELDNEVLVARRDALLNHLFLFDTGKISTIFDASEELAGTRDETLDTLGILLTYIRDMAYLSVGNTDIVNTTLRSRLEKLAAGRSGENIIRMADDVQETRRAIQGNANVKLALDRLFIRIAAPAV